MPGLVAFESGVVEAGQFGGGQRGRVEAGVGGEGAGEFAQDVAERVAVEPQQRPGPHQEVQRITERPRLAPALGERDALRLDLPVPVRPAARPEPQFGLAGAAERQGVRGAAGSGRGQRVGLDDLLVGELAEHLGQQPSLSPPPGVGGQFGRGVEGVAFGPGLVCGGMRHGDSSVGNRIGTAGRRSPTPGAERSQ